MATHDVRDVLNLPTEGTGSSRPSKKQKTAAPRPNLKGLAREVQNLGGDNPIAIVPEISSFKKRRFGTRKPAAKWEMRSFNNSARGDESLVLRHWRRQTEGRPTTQAEEGDGVSAEDKMETDEKSVDMEDSSFAKFNVKVDVPQYSEDQYNSTLANKEWTKDETDYLMDTVRDYDLRWPLVWDRYDYEPKPLVTAEGGEEADTTNPSTAIVPVRKVRSMEDLKSRYYEVAAKMMAVQKPVQYMNPAEYNLHKVMNDFNPADETRRKKFAEAQLSRSKEEAREEESLLIEVRRILARTEKFNQERRELYSRLDYPHTEGTQDLSVFKTSSGLQTLLQNLMTVDKSKKRKSLMGGDGQNTPGSAGPSAHPGSTPISDLRRESIAASTTSNHRDSIGTADGRPEKPTKKGAQQPERRKLTPQEEQIYGVTTSQDRLASGPTFRYERINKILTTKSNAQHQRITNTLTELDVPTRLNMPTKSVVEQMERLLSNIQILLELRKTSDKLDGELKLEQAKKAEREKHNPPKQPGPETQNSGSNLPKKDNSNGDTQSEAASSSTAGASSATLGSGQASASGSAQVANPDTTDTATNKDDLTEVKQEATEEKLARPESSGGHKRSASVLSAISDKSAKRQKK
jgi:DNA methyltransferase 1-associated protein 1